MKTTLLISAAVLLAAPGIAAAQSSMSDMARRMCRRQFNKVQPRRLRQIIPAMVRQSPQFPRLPRPIPMPDTLRSRRRPVRHRSKPWIIPATT
ncbi:hypothetical protein [Sphingobium sp. CECT 9361]|uniref:hypothetical protein n=1 Tax=Sphingobium sp. CECT 9361 TaxID=2845384 RepID=UPI001E605A5F|nr:hypothetical protein [Sphingobium sp. CECT 9361]CAH0350446.1 hypothetical protein SPH9361_01135 [Sphingobium sp. CECT 9361]